VDDGLPPPQDVVEQALAAAAPRSDHCLVIVEETSEVEVRYANNTTTTNGSRRDRRVTVISMRQVDGGMAAGVARRGGDVGIPELVAAAEQDASESPPADDAFALLAPGDAQASAGSGRRFDEPPDSTELSVLSEVLTGLSALVRPSPAGRPCPGRVRRAPADHRVPGDLHRHPVGPRPTAGGAAPGGPERRRRRLHLGRGRHHDFADVSVEGLHAGLEQRLAWAARRVEQPAGRYEVLLPPSAVSDLMVAMAYELSGRNAEDGRTVFSRPGGGTRVGEQLSALPFDLRSDPGEPGLTCSPFLTTTSSSADTSVFDNGLRLDRTDWIAGGMLERLRYHRAGAARSGTAAAGFIGNLSLEVDGATGSLDELVARTERGLLLTCLWYIREVDPATMLLTGLTRDGVYVVEDGKVVGAANNFRFNESPVDLLARVTEVGASVRALGREFGEYFNRTRMPPCGCPTST
jgi:predicted Zn-dependent protease